MDRPCAKNAEDTRGQEVSAWWLSLGLVNLESSSEYSNSSLQQSCGLPRVQEELGLHKLAPCDVAELWSLRCPGFLHGGRSPQLCPDETS